MLAIAGHIASSISLGSASESLCAAAFAEQLVVHPCVRDRFARSSLRTGASGLAEQVGELGDGELRAAGALDPVGVSAERRP